MQRARRKGCRGSSHGNKSKSRILGKNIKNNNTIISMMTRSNGEHLIETKIHHVSVVAIMMAGPWIMAGPKMEQKMWIQAVGSLLVMEVTQKDSQIKKGKELIVWVFNQHINVLRSDSMTSMETQSEKAECPVALIEIECYITKIRGGNHHEAGTDGVPILKGSAGHQTGVILEGVEADGHLSREGIQVGLEMDEWRTLKH
mmetsp:Transcript_18977/g.34226  ORF Transcript_18977/g.34226 Transcript_18977/m.34226 type:complete len:201 (-) Transcript_18977:63-665(-)